MMSLAEVIKTALDQLQYIAKTETVIGEPIQAGPVTLIPVSKVSIGFAAGGAGNDEKSSSQGAGTGGGVTVVPIAFLAVVGEEVNIYPINKNEPDFSSLLALAPEVVRKISKFIGKRKSKEEAGSEDGDEE
jgi:uncharacterized spore protein YtfJ